MEIITTTFDRADYDDERHYQCSRDDDIGVDIDLRPPADDVDEGNSLDEESDDGGDDAGGAGLVGSTNNVARMNEEEESARRREREALTSTPIFRHLTRHFSFVEDEAVRALAASRRRLRIARGRNRRAEGTEAGVSGVDDDATTTTTAREDEGELLEMAMDWLSLHLEESDLRRGFRVRKTNIAGGRPLATTNAPPPRGGILPDQGGPARVDIRFAEAHASAVREGNRRVDGDIEDARSDNGFDTNGVPLEGGGACVLEPADRGGVAVVGSRRGRYRSVDEWGDSETPRRLRRFEG